MRGLRNFKIKCWLHFLCYPNVISFSVARHKPGSTFNTLLENHLNQVHCFCFPTNYRTYISQYCYYVTSVTFLLYCSFKMFPSSKPLPGLPSMFIFLLTTCSDHVFSEMTALSSTMIFSHFLRPHQKHP